VFGIGFPELIVILLLVVIVVGPEQLPDVVRKGMAFLREARRHVSEIKAAVDQQAKTLSEPLQDIQSEISGKPDMARRDNTKPEQTHTPGTS